MTTLSPHGQQALEALRRAVAKALDRKRRLGQYAVVWKDGKITYIGENAPPEPADSDDDDNPPLNDSLHNT